MVGTPKTVLTTTAAMPSLLRTLWDDGSGDTEGATPVSMLAVDEVDPELEIGPDDAVSGADLVELEIDEV